MVSATIADPQGLPFEELVERSAGYYHLGATLYTPATYPNLVGLVNGHRLPQIRSMVVCTEDAVAARDMPAALLNLAFALDNLEPHGMLRFVRPRNARVLRWLVKQRGVERLDGVVLPKVSVSGLASLAPLLRSHPGLALMVTIETSIAFQRQELERLLDVMSALPNRIIAVRIGGNDILSELGMRRPRGLTAYETPLRDAILCIIEVFKPHGIDVTAPVFEHVSDEGTLRREVAMDVMHGLASKTAIHPSQVPTIESYFAPDPDEFDDAVSILSSTAPAVFKSHGSMCEPATHSRWARSILQRAHVYGVACPDRGELVRPLTRVSG